MNQKIVDQFIEELEEIDKVVFRVLGDHDPVSIKIMSEQPISFLEVVMACVSKLDKRISELENERVVH